ncbi:MAG: NTP transferase domain-containing protein [Chloroflexi bacterium]|nr:NTP transferase domain-containing protein [Chloroflexota bacterium]
MKVVIPLAGYGTRLRPHTFSKPKPLINVAGKPVLAHLLDKLSDLDVSEYIFVVGYLGDQIAEYIHHNYTGLPVQFVEQKEMLGQSHAIYLAREYIDTDEAVFVVFGDHIFETDFELVRNPISEAVIYVKEVDDPRRYGVVMLDDQQNVINFVEKAAEPPTNLAIIGLYYINNGRKLVAALRRQIDEGKMTKEEYYIADALQYMVNDGMVFKTETVPNWLDCGTPNAVLAANRFLLGEGGMDNSGEIATNGLIIIPPVRIDPTATIRNAVIGPNVTISAQCDIESSIIRDSIVGEAAKIQNALLDNSLVGQDASVIGRYNSFNVGDSSSVRFA